MATEGCQEVHQENCEGICKGTAPWYVRVVYRLPSISVGVFGTK